MKLIIIDGSPASGKTTLGKLLVEELGARGDKARFLDWDDYVEAVNPTWVWDNKQNEERDKGIAGASLANDTDKYLKQNFIVITVGTFLIKRDLIRYLSNLKTNIPVYLYHLNVSLSLRRKRNHKIEYNPLLDLEKDQRERDAIKKWYGHVYENINSPKEDAKNLLKLVRNNQGHLDLLKFR